MRKVQFISLIILCLCFNSCVEEIELEPSSNNQLLVVDGQISNEFKKHEVSLSSSGFFNDTSSHRMISGAFLTISDGLNTYSLQEEQPGHYFTDSIQGIPGRVYTLEIQYEDNIYMATDTMPSLPTEFEPISFNQDRAFRELEYRRHQFGFTKANKWELFVIQENIDSLPFEVDISRRGLQVGVDVFPPLTYRFTYFTHSNIEVNGLLNFEIPHFYGFNPSFHVIQKKYNLSDSYYEYLRSLFMETEWRGTLFPSTPANVKGNISNGALGFFNTSSVVSVSFKPE